MNLMMAVPHSGVCTHVHTCEPHAPHAHAHTSQALIDNHCLDNLLGEMNALQLMSHLQNAAADAADMTSAPNAATPATTAAIQGVREAQLAELEAIAKLKPNKHQKQVLQQVLSQHTGLITISGGPGSGKTFLTKKLLHHYRTHGTRTVSLQERHVPGRVQVEDNMKVHIMQAHRQAPLRSCPMHHTSLWPQVVSATSGPAATRISKWAQTVHSAFSVLSHNMGQGSYLSPLSVAHPRFAVLQDAQVIIIDEMSMLSTDLFNIVLHRLMTVCGYTSTAELLCHKLIILVGDHCQLPPVCHHTVQGQTYCRACHLTNHPLWHQATKLQLHSSVRHSRDPQLAAFLDVVRQRRPTQAEIDTCFGTSSTISLEQVGQRHTADAC